MMLYEILYTVPCLMRSVMVSVMILWFVCSKMLSYPAIILFI